MSQEMHHIMLGCGYRYCAAARMPSSSLLYSRDRRKGYYVKDYSTNAGEFSIALVVLGDPHTMLPVAYVQQLPESLRGRLIPHISHELTLCYVEQMEADWDPNNLVSTYTDVDAQIQLTLDNAVAAAERGDPADIEMEGEFSAYWRPHEALALLTRPDTRTKLSTCLAESTWSDGSVHREYITTAPDKEKDFDETAKWLNQRDIAANDLKETRITTHYIVVRPSQLAGVAWPPASLRDVLSWLGDVDHNARSQVVAGLLSKKSKRHIIILDVINQDMVAVYVEIDPKASAHQRKNRPGNKKSSVRHLATILGGKQVSRDFKRLNVIRADHDSLLSRNRRRPGIGDLSQKRIALIGCGTIGGYLAELLLRGGAGCANKPYDLYDDDSFGPHNFGRHTLSAHDVGRNKALAMADRLLNSVHIARNIRGFASQFSITDKALEEYDIVIDATGRPPVSKRLAFVIRSLPAERRPTLVHAFNDGNGRAAKVLVDNGSACYSCMVTEIASHRNGIDLRFEGIDQAAEKSISCGSTYTPYDAAVSQITAALTQEAVLNTLEPVMPWTYNEHMLDGSRSKKPRLLPRQKDCPICNDR